jgi:hypothetical protein
MKGNQSDLCQKDYFSALYTNSNILRYCFIAFAIISSIFGTLGLYIIIRFEKRINKQRQTLLNKLAALCLWSCIEFVLIIESTEVARYFYGPLPEKLCFWHQVYRSYVILEVLLQIDAIIIARYIFIFWLKNPTGFNDGVWFWFTFVWIKLSNRITQTCWHLLSVRQPVGYYICSGQDPTEAMKHPLRSYGIVEIFSIIIHFAIRLRIYFYKRKYTANSTSPNFVSQRKSIKIADFVINSVGIIILGISTVFMMKLSSVAPENLSRYPTNIFVYIRSLVIPGLGNVIICTLYFSRHLALRKMLFDKFRNYFLSKLKP